MISDFDNQLAVQMATDLGLSSEDAVQTVPLEVDRTDIRQTWWDVVLLDSIASWGKILWLSYNTFPNVYT